MEREPPEEGFKEALDETKSPSNATADLTAVSESESIAEDDSSSGRHLPGHTSSSQVIGKQKRLIGKLRMEIFMLEESLIAAKAKDVQLLQQQIEELQLDLRRVKNRNRELREKVDSLEGLRRAQPKDERRPSASPANVIEAEHSDLATTGGTTAGGRVASTTQSRNRTFITDEFSTFDEVLRTLSVHHQRLLKNHIASEVDSLRKADLKVIRELTAQLSHAENEKRDAVTSVEKFDRDARELKSHQRSDKATLTENVLAPSSRQFLWPWLLGAMVLAICSAVLFSGWREFLR